jgi:site-specific recombinase XerD
MSTSRILKNPSVIRRQHEGPLGIHIDGYEALLGEHGYSYTSTYVHLHIVADLSRWLKRRRLGVDDVDERTLGRYLQSRRRFVDGYRGASSIPYKFLGMLRDRGIVNHKSMPVAVDTCEVATANFKQYLSQERGLSVSTQCHYTRFAHQFLRERFGRGSIQFSTLSATDVTEFVRRHAHKRSARSAQHLVGSLRAFLRYLRYEGEITTDLAACVPRVANWSHSTLPRFLQPGQVQQVLDHCDRHSAAGLRNYAILLLLARLGLRACEIVSMTLDDIDWETGHLIVRGKGGQRAQMPLPAEVGRAIAVYLKKGRPSCAARRLFIRAQAPRMGFANSAAVSTLVQRALADAGVDSPHTGAHVFRHSLATRCLGREPLWARSDSCCVMHIRTRPRFTRRSMSTPCVRWHYAGREVGDEIPQTSGPGLYSDAAAPRLQDAA